MLNHHNQDGRQAGSSLTADLMEEDGDKADHSNMKPGLERKRDLRNIPTVNLWSNFVDTFPSWEKSLHTLKTRNPHYNYKVVEVDAPDFPMLGIELTAEILGKQPKLQSNRGRSIKIA